MSIKSAFSNLKARTDVKSMINTLLSRCFTHAKITSIKWESTNRYDYDIYSVTVEMKKPNPEKDPPNPGKLFYYVMPGLFIKTYVVLGVGDDNFDRWNATTPLTEITWPHPMARAIAKFKKDAEREYNQQKEDAERAAINSQKELLDEFFKNS